MTSKVIRRYLAVILLMVMSNAFAEGLPDSAASVDDFCQNAQQIIASTALESVNLTHSVDSSFIESSPAPYDNNPAGNLAAYNGKGQGRPCSAAVNDAAVCDLRGRHSRLQIPAGFLLQDEIFRGHSDVHRPVSRRTGDELQRHYQRHRRPGLRGVTAQVSPFSRL